MNNADILKNLDPCSEVLDRARESATLRDWWETSTRLSDLMWLIGKAHVKGTLTRRRLVGVSLRCATTAAHLMPPECLPLLADLTAWCDGGDAVDPAQTSDDLWEIRRAATHAYTDTCTAAYAYTATHAYAAAYAFATAYADAANAAAYAYAAATAAYTDTTTSYAMCDVVRDVITIDEVCAALGLDPDQGVDA
jgi:hypothetical protein